MILEYYVNENECKSIYTNILRIIQPFSGGEFILLTRMDVMKKEVYEAPKLEKVGNVKELTKGWTAGDTDGGAAGSYPNPIRGA